LRDESVTLKIHRLRENTFRRALPTEAPVVLHFNPVLSFKLALKHSMNRQARTFLRKEHLFFR
jgi:hypothetical protein